MNWSPPATAVHCSVCGDPVPFADAARQQQQTRKVCRGIDCRRLLEQEAHMPPALFRAQLEFQRRRIRELRAREAARKAHQERIERTEDAESRAIADRLLARERDPERIGLVYLPSGLDQPLPQDATRRERYREHLQTMLTEAVACASVEELPRDQHYDSRERRLEMDALLARQPRLQQLCDNLCGQCRGGCCAIGGDHAYLSVASVRRVLDEHPEMSADVLVRTYLDHLPPQSMAGACINQTATGCALPRELRSDVCNGYFCPELKALQREWAQRQEDETGEPERWLVIQRANHNWNRFDAEEANAVVAAVWVDADGVTPVEHA